MATVGRWKSVSLRSRGSGWWRRQLLLEDEGYQPFSAIPASAVFVADTHSFILPPGQLQSDATRVQMTGITLKVIGVFARAAAHDAPYLEREAAAVQSHSIRPQVLILIHFWVTVENVFKKATVAFNLEFLMVTTKPSYFTFILRSKSWIVQSIKSILLFSRDSKY